MTTLKFSPARKYFILSIGLFTLFALLMGLPKLSSQTVEAQSSFSCSNVSVLYSAECQTLVDIYNSTNGPNWTDNTGWLQTNTPCSWVGVDCSNDHVSRLFLDNNGLSGPLPNSLGNLTS